jgi:hypothetical protein
MSAETLLENADHTMCESKCQSVAMDSFCGDGDSLADSGGCEPLAGY